MNNKDIINYLKNIVELEQMIYEQDTILSWLDSKIKFHENPQLKTKNSLPNYKPEFKLRLRHISEDGEEEFGGIYFFMFSFLSYVVGAFIFHSLQRPLLPAILIGILSVVIFQIKNIVEEWLDYQRLLSDYETKVKEVTRKNKMIDVDNNHYLLYCKAILPKLTEEFHQIYIKRRETFDLLNKCYDLDIIYPKYRSFTCAATILEYFMSGRCSKLTGYEGAYNLLENDIKYQMILTKLDTIIYNLEEIRKNQEYLYNAIQESNLNIREVLTTINSSMNEMKVQIKSSSAKIEQKLDSIDYSESCTKRNTQILSDMELYHFLKN